MDDLDPSQKRAVDLLCTKPFGIVTGGPGTGKTTCLRQALVRMERHEVRYALAAPTGKAAKRMSEATGRAASTIHRLLGWKRTGFDHGADNTLPFDVVIIDEASMLDVELAAALVGALDARTRFMLVGDANQLPSVGPGRVLADLVDYDVVPVARLERVHRAAQESWICRNAPRVLAGKPLDLDPRPDFAFVQVEDATAIGKTVAELVSRPAYRASQVLSPQRTGACGVTALNQTLQAELNPAAPEKHEWGLDGRVLREGDPVIHTVNNYQLEVFNGEVGVLSCDVEERPYVRFEDREVFYGPMSLSQLQLAYALTVHKYQGSEVAWAICIVHSAHSFMLTKQLFYTAITRAKKGVILVGNQDGLRQALSTNRPEKRNTTLIERITGEL